MYRILDLLKDTYLTNKIIAGSGSTTSNVGQAGTLDLFKLWTQTVSGSTPVVEKSRILIHPDIATVQALTGTILDFTHNSFKCYLSMVDVYGGQTTPSNFTLSLVPLSKSWNEGRGTVREVTNASTRGTEIPPRTEVCEVCRCETTTVVGVSGVSRRTLGNPRIRNTREQRRNILGRDGSQNLIGTAHVTACKRSSTESITCVVTNLAT
jgi:hypothetical protein